MDATIAKKITGFFSAYPARHYPKGQILIHAHDNPTHVFQLLEGRVKQYDISHRGDEVLLNIFKPPAFFPMSYAINKTPNVYFYEAETDIDAHLAPTDDVVGFLKANADVLYDLLGRVYRGTDGLIGRLAHLMAGSARSRLLYELLIECRRFGSPSEQGIAIALTESDLGAHAGLARETVSRELRKLKDEGLIAITKNHITVSDIDRLAASVTREL
jgi:CRP/FNR family cyclic AMP-dependent transcriptional regulator